MDSAVPRATPTAVAPSAQNSVPINTQPQLGPYTPMSGSQIAPKVPRTELEGDNQTPANPKFGGYRTKGGPRQSGNAGAPSVPQAGYLFVQGPIDEHYRNQDQGGKDPYCKVNKPPTRGMFTRIQMFQNNAAHSAQDVDNAGWRVRPGQQRTSVMRNQMPNLGDGYSPETYEPKYQPQQANTYKYGPVTGTDPYGSGVLNSDSYGAGQTAGGEGGNQYTPTPGPPATNSTAGDNSYSPEPTWG